MKKELYTAWGLFRNSLRTAVYKATGKTLPFEYLVYEITDACNSRCRHCDIWKKKTHSMLSLEDIEKIFKTGFLKNVKELIVTGGEPVLRPDLAQAMLLMQKYVSLEAVFSLSTNGLLPNRVLEVSNQCLENGMNLVVGVSLDGVGSHHDDIRGVLGNFEKVDYLLKELLALKKKYKKLQVAIGYTFSSYTVEYFTEVQAYAKNLGLNFLPQVFEIFSYYSNNQHRQANLTKEMKSAVLSCRDTFQKEIIMTCLEGKSLNYQCASLNNFFLLHSNGDVAPCLKYSEMKVGNLKNSSFRDIFSSEQACQALLVVRQCKGCSNTWATIWSMKYWVFPFLGKLVKTSFKKIFSSGREKRKSSCSCKAC